MVLYSIFLTIFSMWNFHRLNIAKEAHCATQGVDNSHKGKFVEFGSESPLFRFVLYICLVWATSDALREDIHYEGTESYIRLATRYISCHVMTLGSGSVMLKCTGQNTNWSGLQWYGGQSLPTGVKITLETRFYDTNCHAENYIYGVWTSSIDESISYYVRAYLFSVASWACTQSFPVTSCDGKFCKWWCQTLSPTS